MFLSLLLHVLANVSETSVYITYIHVLIPQLIKGCGMNQSTLRLHDDRIKYLDSLLIRLAFQIRKAIYKLIV